MKILNQPFDARQRFFVFLREKIPKLKRNNSDEGKCFLALIIMHWRGEKTFSSRLKLQYDDFFGLENDKIVN